jgi:hypothetical protein
LGVGAGDGVCLFPDRCRADEAGVGWCVLPPGGRLAGVARGEPVLMFTSLRAGLSVPVSGPIAGECLGLLLTRVRLGVLCPPGVGLALPIVGSDAGAVGGEDAARSGAGVDSLPAALVDLVCLVEPGGCVWGWAK